MTYDADHMYAAENFMILVGSLVTICILQKLLWLRCKYAFWRGLPDHPEKLGIANYLLAGIIIMELGWVFNRLFWLLFRTLKSWGLEEYADGFQYGFQWMSATSLIWVAIGMSIAAGPVLRVRFGRYWPAAALMFFAAAWMLGYTIPDMGRNDVV